MSAAATFWQRHHEQRHYEQRHDEQRRDEHGEVEQRRHEMQDAEQVRSTAGSRPNPLLVETAASLPPGRAIELGCGTGGSAIWLAERGWHVTAVDIAGAALELLRRRAGRLGVADRITTCRHDLSAGPFATGPSTPGRSTDGPDGPDGPDGADGADGVDGVDGPDGPDGAVDLVFALYLHTPFALPRGTVLRDAAQALRPGGRLLIVDHGSTDPWSWDQRPDVHFPTPAQVADTLGLDPACWSTVRADMPRRQVPGSDGTSVTVTDNVLCLRRRLPRRLHQL